MEIWKIQTGQLRRTSIPTSESYLVRISPDKLTLCLLVSDISFFDETQVHPCPIEFNSQINSSKFNPSIFSIEILCPDYEYLRWVAFFNYDAYWAHSIENKFIFNYAYLTILSWSNCPAGSFNQIMVTYGDVLVFLLRASFTQDDQLLNLLWTCGLWK